MKFLSPKAHGVIDYAAVLLLFLAPSIWGFDGPARMLSYALGVAQGGMSLLTAYPLGAVKAISFPVHGGIELAAGVFMIIAPFLFGFSGPAFAFFLASGIALGIVWLVTDYRAAERTVGGRAPARTTV